MMTLDEAIRHAERVVNFCEVNASGRDPHSPKFESDIVRKLMKCAEQHKQLAKWLKELKRLKEQEPCEDAVSRSSLLNKLDDCYKEKIKVAPDNMAEGFMQAEKLIKQEPSVKPVACIAKVKFNKEDMQKIVDEKVKEMISNDKEID